MTSSTSSASAAYTWMKVSFEKKKEDVTLKDDLVVRFCCNLTLFYISGLGIVVLHVMVPQPHRFSLFFLT
jgi:hypothetical protein